MGRYYFDKKTTKDECKTVDMPWLNKHGYLNGWKAGGIKWSNRWGEESTIGITVDTEVEEPYAKFNYTFTHREPPEKYDYKVRLTTTPCNFGGVRYWFICPLVIDGKACSQRVGTLFLPPGRKYFGCRHCYKLSYESRNVNRRGKFGAFYRFFELEKKLDQLHEDIKIPFRNGKPTKKYLRYEEAWDELTSMGRFFDNI